MEPKILINFVSVFGNLEGKRGSRGKQQKIISHNLPFAGLHGRVQCSFRSRADFSPHSNNELTSQSPRPFVHFGGEFRIENNLHDTRVIP